jgi:hypothetical protein
LSVSLNHDICGDPPLILVTWSNVMGHSIYIDKSRVNNNKLESQLDHLTIITGQRAYDNTPDATLPRRVLLGPDLPLVPITIRSTFSVSI